MKSSALEMRMRLLEAAHDQFVPAGRFMVARLDGRNFARLTKDTHEFMAPFDERVRDLMIETTRHLMQSGPRVICGYTQSDEINLVLHPEDRAFGRRIDKINSILAGEASSKFSVLLSDLAAFDCRIIQLAETDHVVEYLLWRQEDAHRNALNGHSYWMFRKGGEDAKSATRHLKSLSSASKKELLLGKGIDFNELPAWESRGVCLLWETFERNASNPLTGESVVAVRRRVKVMLSPPKGLEFCSFVARTIAKDLAPSSEVME